MKKLSYYLLALLFVVVVSCSDKDEFTATDTQSVESEATTDAYFEDTDDMATQAVAANDGATTGSREADISGRSEGGTTPNDGRFTGATVTLTFASDNQPGTNNIHGYIVIDFKTGVTDLRGNVRKGKIKIEFIGRKFMLDSKVITTLDGYYINGIKIEGTRTVTSKPSSSTPIRFDVAITDGKVIWADGTFATREAFRTLTLTSLSGDFTVSQTDGKLYAAAGTNRNGKTYQVTITKPLVYKRSCGVSNKISIAVEGTKVLTTEAKTITIDYGDGTCDRKISLTSNSKSMEVTVNGDI